MNSGQTATDEAFAAAEHERQLNLTAVQACYQKS